MIDLYTFNTSNGHRAAIILEECGLPYRVHKVDLAKGEHKTPAFLNINPAGAIPAIVDHDVPGGPLKLSQSGAIVLYAAEKTGRFLPADPARRALALQWLMLAVTDVARASTSIFLSSTVLPDKSPANVAYFEEQTLRYLRVAEARLAGRDFLADELSVADFALYPLYAVRKALVDKAGDLPELTRWGASLAARPGVDKGMRAAD
ncbi:MAG TPA: glutathione S-transferase [Casimicrobiaceae bacterium]|nr:glutathione S-transferase [Casimicrobiaceae bacterium]